jgi:hypothetical protein
MTPVLPELATSGKGLFLPRLRATSGDFGQLRDFGQALLNKHLDKNPTSGNFGKVPARTHPHVY